MANSEPERIIIRCECGAKLALKAAAAGHKAQCPKCNNSFVVPGPESSDTGGVNNSLEETANTPGDNHTTTERIVVTCECGQKLKVSADMVGKKGKCPKCNQVFVIQDPADTSAESTDTGDLTGSGSLLDELAGQEGTAEAEEKVQTSSSTWQTPCPHCNAMKPSDADVCSICGYDSKARRIRKKTKSVESGAVTSTAKVTRAVKTVGPIVRGCIFSGIGALLGGAAWFIIAILTEYELGIIAWAVGGLAGFGMHLGYGQPSGRAGIAAAGIAFLGIVAAKAMIFVFIVYSMIMAVVTGDTDNIEIQRAVLASFIANEILDERGIHSESEREAQWESVYKEADQRVAKMSDQEVRTKFKEYRDELVEAADPRTLRLASHYSNMRANQKGLAYDSQARETMYEEELDKYKSMSDDELDKAVSDLEAWESGGKWDDAEYVRTFLIYEHINEAITNMESEEEGEDISSREWKEMYDQAVAQVDDISPAERLSRAKQIETERERKIEEAMAKWKDQAAVSDPDADVGGVLGLFASSMFGFFDLVFMFLALGTAYRVASGGVGETE